MDLVTRPFAIPMTMPFRRVAERRGVLIHGPAGWGEFSPFPDYGPAVAARWLPAALEAATQAWPESRRNRIPVNAIVPAVEPERALEIAAASGCSTAKVKVGRGDDEQRVAAVRDALGPSGKVRVDANGAWDVDGAERMIKVLDRYELEYVEQPVATLEEMAELRRRVDVPLAADESIRNAADPGRVARLEAADIVVLKVQPLGGVRAALRVAEAAGLPAVVSSAVETSIGLSAGVALAAALPNLPYACGLGTASLLAGDVVADPLVPAEGYIDARRPAVHEPSLALWELRGSMADTELARMRDAEALL